MEQPWFLATSLTGPTTKIMKLYGRRFTCEENFRDGKDRRFGIGFKLTRVSTVGRRDRFLAIAVIATAILTLLGWAGESLGFDALVRANTVKHRAHSLFRQGREYLRLTILVMVVTLRNELWKLIKRNAMLLTS